jgi:hypothetical protein
MTSSTVESLLSFVRSNQHHADKRRYSGLMVKCWSALGGRCGIGAVTHFESSSNTFFSVPRFWFIQKYDEAKTSYSYSYKDHVYDVSLDQVDQVFDVHSLRVFTRKYPCQARRSYNAKQWPSFPIAGFLEAGRFLLIEFCRAAFNFSPETNKSTCVKCEWSGLSHCTACVFQPLSAYCPCVLNQRTGSDAASTLPGSQPPASKDPRIKPLAFPLMEKSVQSQG